MEYFGFINDKAPEIPDIGERQRRREQIIREQLPGATERLGWHWITEPEELRVPETGNVLLIAIALWSNRDFKCLEKLAELFHLGRYDTVLLFDIDQVYDKGIEHAMPKIRTAQSTPMVACYEAGIFTQWIDGPIFGWIADNFKSTESPIIDAADYGVPMRTLAAQGDELTIDFHTRIGDDGRLIVSLLRNLRKTSRQFKMRILISALALLVCVPILISQTYANVILAFPELGHPTGAGKYLLWFGILALSLLTLFGPALIVLMCGTRSVHIHLDSESVYIEMLYRWLPKASRLKKRLAYRDIMPIASDQNHIALTAADIPILIPMRIFSNRKATETTLGKLFQVWLATNPAVSDATIWQPEIDDGQ